VTPARSGRRNAPCPATIARRLIVALAVLLTPWSAAREAFAQVTGRVLIVTSSESTALLDEGLVRVRGELAALGLATDLRLEGDDPGSEAKEAAQGFEGALVFERFGDWLRIQAWNPAAPVPVTQWIDASDPSVDAEVIAVRAVEALRAALLPYLRSREKAPEPPAGDTSLEQPSANVEPQLTMDTLEPEPARRTRPHHGSFWVGPALGFDLGTNVVHLGGQLGFSYGTPTLLGAGRFEVTRAELPVRAEAGEVEVMRFALHLDARLTASLLERLDAHLALGGGVVHHRVRGIAAPGYSGQNARHTSPSLLFELGAHYWFAPRLGAYLSACGTLATDAPVVRVDRRPIATLGRPEIALSSGMVLGLD
jgi:hypothetical protein